MTRPLCIYCTENPADSKEHWLPYWIGRFEGVDTLLGHLCERCNKQLGDSLDNEMARVGPEAIDRFRLGITGRRSHRGERSPYLFKTQQPESPTTASARPPGFGFDILMGDVPGAQPPHRRPLRQVVVRDAAGAHHPLAIPDGATPEWLREKIRLHGLEGCTLTHIICEAEGVSVEEEAEADQLASDLPAWVRHVLKTAFRWPSAEGVTWFLPGGGSEGVLSSPTRVLLTYQYVRALAKLGFHYALRFANDLSGHEPFLDPVKQFIMQGDGAVEQFVDLEGRPFILTPGGRLGGDGHFFMLEADAEGIRVHIRTFAASALKRPSVLVRLAVSPMGARPMAVAHHLRLFSSLKDGYIGDLHELPTILHEGLRGVPLPPWLLADDL